ncbi:hypothetical protein Tco_1293303 [Tanacetum coccineum]
MVPTKKVDKTPYELWYGKVPNLSYLKVWGCEALVKRDTPDKLQQRSVKCIFIGYPKETMGYCFYFPPENKIVVASEIPMEVKGFKPPQEEVILIRSPFSSTTMGDENPIRTLGDYSKPSHEGYRNTIELPKGNNVVPLRSDTIRLVQNGCSFHGLRSEDPNQHLKDFLKLVDSLGLDEDLSLYDNQSWNDPRDFAKPVKEIALPQDVLSTSDRRLIELQNQVQRLMEAHLAPTQPT